MLLTMEQDIIDGLLVPIDVDVWLEKMKGKFMQVKL